MSKPAAKKQDKKDKKDNLITLNPADFRDVDKITAYLNDAIKVNVASTPQIESGQADLSAIYSTGVMSLDLYLGCGGLVGGRIVNAFGWEGAGKTLAALVIAAAVQRHGGRFAYIDAEGTMSPSMCRSVGIDLEKMILVQSTPERILSGEDYFDMIRLLCHMGVEFILVDSMPALVPSIKLGARIGEGQMLTQQQMFSEGLSAITAVLNGHKQTVLYLINQMRSKPGVMFGPTDNSTGGNAIKFYETYALQIKKLEDIVRCVLTPNGQYVEQRIGAKCQVTARKNKVAPIPVKPIEYTVYFGDFVDKDGMRYYTGIDVIADAVSVGVQVGIIERNGNWHSWNGLKGNGEAQFRDELRMAVQTDPTLLDKLRDQAVLGIKEVTPILETQ